MRARMRIRPGAGRWPAILAATFLVSPIAQAQDRAAAPLAAPAGAASRLGDRAGPGAVGTGQSAAAAGAPGGAASADFDSLIDLITSTVDVESWAENGTGEGDIQPFFNGVYVDAAGALRLRQGGGELAGLDAIRSSGARRANSADEEPRAASARAASPLRYVSLPRLETAIADCQRRHAPLDPAMLTLAGLQRVRFVLVYPETGDLVVAGPAGDWLTAPSGAIVSADTGRPVVRLDDFLTLWRRQRRERASAFGCSIVPRQEELARTQEYLTASAARPLEPGQRRAWLTGLRDSLGVQDVEYSRIDPDTRVAGLLLAADYHMKLVGMGLAEGVPGVKSYLATVRLDAGGQPPAMSVLRWWFAMPPASVEATEQRDAFAMPGRSVQVLSENEMLAARGQRVHTGQSEAINEQFAASFTKQFAALADKYPVYGELERVFELALALALVEREGLAEQAGWSPSLLVDEKRLRLPRVSSPKTVETVVNHRVIGGRHVIAGISGGVRIDGAASLNVVSAAADSAGTLERVKGTALAKPQAAGGAWWWD